MYIDFWNRIKKATKTIDANNKINLYFYLSQSHKNPYKYLLRSRRCPVKALIQNVACRWKNVRRLALKFQELPAIPQQFGINFPKLHRAVAKSCQRKI